MRGPPMKAWVRQAELEAFDIYFAQPNFPSFTVEWELPEGLVKEYVSAHLRFVKAQEALDKQMEAIYESSFRAENDAGAGS